MSDFLTLFLGIFLRPRSVARLFMKLEMPMAALWPLIGIVAICYGLSWHQPIMFRAIQEGNALVSGIGPAILTVAFFVYFVFLSFVLARLGAMMGGLGGFQQALALSSLIPMFLLIPQLVTLLLMLISFNLFVSASLFLHGCFFWISTCIVDELHRFESLGRSFILLLFVNILAIMCAGVVLLILALILGLAALPTFPFT